MEYNKALMIVRNAPSGYTPEEIRAAAVHILGTIDATEEDILDAGNALGYADRQAVKISFSPKSRCGDLDSHPFSGTISFQDY